MKNNHRINILLAAVAFVAISPFMAWGQSATTPMTSRGNLNFGEYLNITRLSPVDDLRVYPGIQLITSGEMKFTSGNKVEFSGNNIGVGVDKNLGEDGVGSFGFAKATVNSLYEITDYTDEISEESTTLMGRFVKEMPNGSSFGFGIQSVSSTETETEKIPGSSFSGSVSHSYMVMAIGGKFAAGDGVSIALEYSPGYKSEATWGGDYTGFKDIRGRGAITSIGFAMTQKEMSFGLDIITQAENTDAIERGLNTMLIGGDFLMDENSLEFTYATFDRPTMTTGGWIYYASSGTQLHLGGNIKMDKGMHLNVFLEQFEEKYDISDMKVSLSMIGLIFSMDM